MIIGIIVITWLFAGLVVGCLVGRFISDCDDRIEQMLTKRKKNW